MRNFKLFSFLAIGGVMLAAAFASAAALNIGPNTIQVGEDDAVCQTDSVRVVYGVELDTTPPETNVSLSNIDEACAGMKAVVRILDEGGNVLGGNEVTIPNDITPDTKLNILGLGVVAPEEIFTVRVAIHSGSQ